MVDGNMADHVDLNFGCPVPKVTCSRVRPCLGKPTFSLSYYSAWSPYASRRASPSPRRSASASTITMRPSLEAGHIAQEEGCTSRNPACPYHRRILWRSFRLVPHRRAQEHLNIPVFGNGDIWEAEDALEMVRDRLRRCGHRPRMPGPAVAVRQHQKRLRGQSRTAQPESGRGLPRGSTVMPSCLPSFMRAMR